MRPLGLLLGVLVLTLLGSGSHVAAADADELFPRYPTIEDNVVFWRSVFSEWTLGQVVLHDLDYPAIRYEVADLPEPIEERYSKEQKEFIEKLNEKWEDRLKLLERKVRHREPLSDEQKSWALAITTHAGSGAIEGAHERVRSQRGLRERFRRGMEMSHRYDTAFREIFRDLGLPEDLAYLPHVESSFQVRAHSSAGAVGVWQFTRGTGKLYLNINAAVDERFDPVLSARGAAGYLRDAYQKLGDWAIALTSYNHGVAGMRRAVDKLGADYERIFAEYDGRRFGFASRNFYAEFLAAREIASSPEVYFPEGVTPEAPVDVEQVVLESRSTIRRLAQAYDLALDPLVALNPSLKTRAVKSGYALPRGSRIWLPGGTLERLSRAGHEPDYAISADVATGTGVYVVRTGDTLSGIARRQGTSLAELRDLNGMSRGASVIHRGQKLLVPQAGAIRRSANGIHVVGSGETLSEIAQTYGISTHELRSSNGIGAGRSLIKVGQKLHVPGKRTTVHVVTQGQTLGSIASKYGTDVAQLRRLNGISSAASLIRIGQRLKVPASDPAKVHLVKSGESLIRIAMSYGVQLVDLLRANRLTVSSVIHPGQPIRIPIHGSH